MKVLLDLASTSAKSARDLHPTIGTHWSAHAGLSEAAGDAWAYYPPPAPPANEAPEGRPNQ